MTYQKLLDKIEKKSFKLGVIGLGYVGLPLACEFASSGIEVIGFDVSSDKVNQIKKGESYIQDIPENIVKKLTANGKLKATTNFSLLSTVDAISICVPTPLRKTKDPDMSYIFEAVEAIKKQLRKDHIIILESTTYPGTTEEMLLPTLEETGLKIGEDFFLAFSPERVDPGNKSYNTHNTPKVIGGVTKKCAHIAEAIYKIAVQTIVLVSSPKSAELVKLYENTFRSVNIAMANEMVMICDHLGVDVWEVIDAAATKPFGFMPFYPGPGLGGHCIPIDPLYLSWKLKSLNYDARFISLAGEINSSMPKYVVEKTSLALNAHKQSINGANILILGLAYKPDINDYRESPAIDIIIELKRLGANISYHDQFIPECNIEGLTFKSINMDNKILKEQDCIVIVTNHSYFKIAEIVQNSKLIVDTRNITKGFQENHIFKL